MKSRCDYCRDHPGESAGNVQRGVHSAYNSRIYGLNKPFPATNQTKVFVCGNSWARDWANVLLESVVSNRICISYMHDVRSEAAREELRSRIASADVVFANDISSYAPVEIRNLFFDRTSEHPPANKYFGVTGGYVYNLRRRAADGVISIPIPDEIAASQAEMKRSIGENRYIDMMQVCVYDGRIRVFTDEGKMISQDGTHLTRAGARYFSKKLEAKIIDMIGRGK